MKALGLTLLGLVVVGCHFGSPVFTPNPKDPAFHCHRQDGSVDPNAVWCFPTDGTHTCCLENYICGTLEGQPNCEYQGNPDNGSNGGDLFAARKPMPRMSEAP
jgi:hypothetical protein